VSIPNLGDNRLPRGAYESKAWEPWRAQEVGEHECVERNLDRLRKLIPP
jgi:hypothetical protein